MPHATKFVLEEDAPVVPEVTGDVVLSSMGEGCNQAPANTPPPIAESICHPPITESVRENHHNYHFLKEFLRGFLKDFLRIWPLADPKINCPRRLRRRGSGDSGAHFDSFRNAFRILS